MVHKGEVRRYQDGKYGGKRLAFVFCALQAEQLRKRREALGSLGVIAISDIVYQGIKDPEPWEKLPDEIRNTEVGSVAWTMPVGTQPQEAIIETPQRLLPT